VTEEEIRLVEEEVSRDSSTWDLGGFSPQSFETTKWSTLFPDLKKEFPLTENRIYITRLWMFYLTRLEFLQYLHFLIDVGDDLAKWWASQPGGVKAILVNTENDAKFFAIHSDTLKKKIMKKLEDNSDFSEADYLETVLLFDEELRDDRHFTSKKVYNTFFDNYDVFHENPLGFVEASLFKMNELQQKYMTRKGPKVMDRQWEWHTFEWKPTDGKRLPALLTDARRCYPVINVDGNSVMVYYQPCDCEYGTHKPIKREFIAVDYKNWLMAFWKDPNTNNEFARETYDTGTKLRFYGLNYEHLERNGGKMVGVPFLGKLPFDSVLSPLRP